MTSQVAKNVPLFRVFRDETDPKIYCIREVDFDENPISNSLYSGDFEKVVDVYNNLMYPNGTSDEALGNTKEFVAE